MPERLMKFMMEAFYCKLNELINSWDGKMEATETRNCNQHYVSIDFYLKVIGLLCSKYPLLIPIVDKHEISWEELKKDLRLPWFFEQIRRNPASGTISFPEYVLLTINFHKNCWPFFLSLSKGSFSFTKQENATWVSSSKSQQSKYLALLRRELLQSCETGLFTSQLKVERFKEYINLYNRILFQFKSANDANWEKKEILKTLKTFNYVAEHFSAEDSDLIIYTHFYLLFRQAYKGYIKLLFTEKTGRNESRHLENLKYYLNKRLNKGLFKQNSTDSLLEKAEQSSLKLNESVESFVNDANNVAKHHYNEKDPKFKEIRLDLGKEK